VVFLASPPPLPQLQSYLLGGLVTCLFIFLFISISSTEPLGLSVTGALGRLTAGVLWQGCRLEQASQVFECLGVRLRLQPRGPLGQLTFTCNEGVNVIFINAQ